MLIGHTKLKVVILGIRGSCLGSSPKIIGCYLVAIFATRIVLVAIWSLFVGFNYHLLAIWLLFVGFGRYLVAIWSLFYCLGRSLVAILLFWSLFVGFGCYLAAICWFRAKCFDNWSLHVDPYKTGAA